MHSKFTPHGNEHYRDMYLKVRDELAVLQQQNITKVSSHSELTPRDYFAAQAVTWFLAKLDDEGVIDDPDLLRQFASKHAYKLADAMLKERARNAQ
jgi:hypothetical protein